MRNVRRVTTGIIALALMLLSPAVTAQTAPTIETLAGGLPRSLPATAISVHPTGLALDDAGTLYVADGGNGLIWEVRDGAASVIAGNGLPCSLQFSYYEADAACRGAGFPTDVPATSVSLSAPGAMALGPDGDLYFSETRAHVVRRLDLDTGTLHTYAGTSLRGFAGDGGPATDARLAAPAGLAFDSTGNLYIADTDNHRIRRVAADGTITTVVGCGERQIPACATLPDDGSPFEGTEMPYPYAVAVDAQDRVYVQVYGAIFRLDLGQQIFRRIVGAPYRYADFPGQGENGPAAAARITFPFSMTFAPGGDLVFTDTSLNRVQRVEAPVGPDAMLRHVGGCSTCGQDGVDNHHNGYRGDGGPAKSAAFAFFRSTHGDAKVVVEGDGDVYVADVLNNRVRRIDATTGVVDTVVGNGDRTSFGRLYAPTEVQPAVVQGGHAGDGGPAANAMLFGPSDVALDDDGTAYVLDRYAGRVRRIAPDGTITTVAGRSCPPYTCSFDPGSGGIGDGGPATQAVFYGASHLALSPDGSQLYISDTHHERLRQVNLGTTPVTVYPLSSSPVTIQPGAIATVVGDGNTCSLLVPDCADGTSALSTSFGHVAGVAVDEAGTVYVSDASHHHVLQIEPQTGAVTLVAGAPNDTVSTGCVNAQPADGQPGRLAHLCGPTDLALGDDVLYVAESGIGIGGAVARSRVRAIDLSSPLHVTSVAAGNSQNGYAGDGGPAADAMLAQPHGVAVGPDGSLYIADTGNSRVRVVSPDGTITTLAGTGEFLGFLPWPSPGEFAGCALGGDGGPAAEALLCGPTGVAVGPDGEIVVADQVNNRVRVISP